MSNEISVDIKTVLTGEVLGPEEEQPKKSKEQEEIEMLKAKLARAEGEREAYIAQEIRRRSLEAQQYYGQVNMNHQLSGQFWRPQANPFGCMNHFGPWRCQTCGRY